MQFITSFFKGSPAATPESTEAEPGESITQEMSSSKHHGAIASDFAAANGLTLSDNGCKEWSYRFKSVRSFGVVGSQQRLFVCRTA